MLHAIYPEASNYPGAFIPNPLKFETELSYSHESKEDNVCTISETGDYYKIELAAPGFQREDFFVNITGLGHLSITALHSKKDLSKTQEAQNHASNINHLNRNILLPENVDTDFLKSEYRHGILSLWFSKTDKQCQKTASTIAIY